MRVVRLDQAPAAVLRIREPFGVVVAVCGPLAEDEVDSLASAVLSPAEYDELRSSLHLPVDCAGADEPRVETLR